MLLFYLTPFSLLKAGGDELMDPLASPRPGSKVLTEHDVPGLPMQVSSRRRSLGHTG